MFVVDGSDKKKSVVQVCSVTVACCIGGEITYILGYHDKKTCLLLNLSIANCTAIAG